MLITININNSDKRKIEDKVPGAYQQICMNLPERSIVLKVRMIMLYHVHIL